MHGIHEILQSRLTAFGRPKLRGIRTRYMQMIDTPNSLILPNPTIRIRLDLDSALESLPPLVHASVGLGTHDTTSPMADGVLVLLEVTVLDGGAELGELALVLGADLSEGENGSGLLVNDGTESGLALDYGVRDAHLAAKSGKEDNQLNGINVVGDEHERRLLVLDEANNVVETELGGVGLLGHILLLLALGDGGGLLGQALLLLGLGLRSVLVEELESLGGGCDVLADALPTIVVCLTVAVEDVLELSDRRRDLQPEVEDLLLALETDVRGPSHHARKVALGLNVLADTEVPGALLKKGVLSLSEPAAMQLTISGRTLAGFLEPALPWGKGAGAAFLALGAILSSRLSLREKPLANVHSLNSSCCSKRERALLPLCTLAIFNIATFHDGSMRRICRSVGWGDALTKFPVLVEVDGLVMGVSKSRKTRMCLPFA